MIAPSGRCRGDCPPCVESAARAHRRRLYLALALGLVLIAGAAVALLVVTR